MAHKRKWFRIVLDRKGALTRDNTVAPCDLLDLTEEGVQIKTDLPLQPGDQLHLHFNLTTDCAINCAIQVTRVVPPYVGATIISLSPDDQQHLCRFIDQLNALHMTGF